VDEKMFDAVTRGIGDASAVRRRTVLGGASAAFALLLSGILSPTTVDVAEAGGDNNNNKNKKKKRRQKNKDEQPPVTSPPPGNTDDPPGLGSSGWIYVRMIVENLTNADIDFEGITLYEEYVGKICRTKSLQTIHPNEAITFAPPDDNDGTPNAYVNAVLNDKYSIEAAQEQGPNHDFPVVWASSTLHPTNIEGCKTGNNVAIFNRKMGVGQKIPFTMEGQKFELLRENDIDNARLFRLRVLAS
jgi:hypothetical protein